MKIQLSSIVGLAQKIIFCLLIFYFSITLVHADTNYWICDSGIHTFNDSSCWSTASVPIAGEYVVFNASGTSNVNITSDSLPQNLIGFTVEDTFTGTIHFNPLFAEGSWGPHTGTQEWNVTGNISINGGVVKIYGDYPYNITPQGHGQIWRSVNGNIIVGPNALIDGEDLGFPAHTGPGAVGSGSYGGTHGGAGGSNALAIYGDAQSPTSLGSGGTNAPGGSAIKLEANNSLVVDGTISVNASTDNQRRGAGGSIWLHGTSVEGIGSLYAVGGRTQNTRDAGGGGRIAITSLNELSWNGYISADGGISNNELDSWAGSGGSIYLSSTNLTLNSTLSSVGFSGGNITLSSPLLSILGNYNATTNKATGTDGSITLDYSDCNSDYSDATINPLRIDLSNCVPPAITIIEPKNRTYAHSTLTFNVSLDIEGAAWYSLDGGVTNHSMDTTDGFSHTDTHVGLSDGSHTLIVYANESVGGLASSEEITFSVNASAPVIVASISRDSCTAPCGIFANALGTESNTTHEPFHELFYLWDFGNPDASFIYRQDVTPNIAKGAIAAHVFDTPGVYTITLNVTDWNSVTSTSEFVLDVQDPEVVYDGNTFCVSVTSNFTDCPTGDVENHFTNITESIDAAFSTDGPRRLLIHKDEEYNIRCEGNAISGVGPYHIGSYGTGTDPVIKKEGCLPEPGNLLVGGGFFRFSSSEDVSVQGLTMIGGYNPSDGTGNRPSAISTSGEHVTIYRNNISGFGLTISPSNPQYFFVVDNNISNWQDYGSYGSLRDTAFLGNSMKQKKDVWNAPGGRECRGNLSYVPCPAAHSPIRIPTSQRVVLSFNDMFNNAGWSSGGRAHGATIRVIVDSYGNHTIISDNILKGGFSVVSIDDQQRDDTLLNPADRLIFERNLLIATPNTHSLIGVKPPGKVIRNNILLKLNDGHQFPDEDGGLGESEFGKGIQLQSTRFEELIDSPVWIYGNSFIVLEEERAERTRFLRVTGNLTDDDIEHYGATNMHIYNNLAYIPHLNGIDSPPRTGFYEWLRNDSALTSDYNLFFAPNHGNFSVSRILDGSTQGNTLAQWQGLGFDLNSLELDPLLINPEGDNFKLTANSPARDAGFEIKGWFEDFEGRWRLDGDFDIGAYAYIVGDSELGVQLVSPSNNSATNVANINFTAIVASNHELANTTLHVWNDTSLIYSQTTPLNGTAETVSSNFTFSEEGVYRWNHHAYDQETNQAWASENFTIIYDTTSPMISITSPSSTTKSNHVTSLSFSASDDNALASCAYSLDGGVTTVNVACNQVITGISSNQGSNTWVVYAYDAAGNNASDSVTFQVTIPTSGGNGGSGGGGGGGGAAPPPTSSTYDLEGQTTMTQEYLRVNDVLKDSTRNVEVVIAAIDATTVILRHDSTDYTLGVGGSVVIGEVLFRIIAIELNRATITMSEELPFIPTTTSDVDEEETETTVTNETQIVPEVHQPLQTESSSHNALLYWLLLVAIVLISSAIVLAYMYTHREKKQGPTALHDYVKNARESGFDSGQIRQKLKDVGWADETIEKTMEELNK